MHIWMDHSKPISVAETEFRVPKAIQCNPAKVFGFDGHITTFSSSPTALRELSMPHRSVIYAQNKANCIPELENLDFKHSKGIP